MVASLIDQTVTNDGFGNTETLVSVEALGSGTRFADTLVGNDSDNLLTGEFGDLLIGNGGDDHFTIGGAPATLAGGDGVDTIILFFGDIFGIFVADANMDGLADIEFATHGVSIDMASLTNQILDDGYGHAASFTGIENVAEAALTTT